MMVYVGDNPGKAFREEARSRGWGIMSISGRPTPCFPWAFDNGAFGYARRGMEFVDATYLRRVEIARCAATEPDFAVIPDIPQLGETSRRGGLESLFFSLHWLPQMPYEWPLYLALQDGMEPSDIDDVEGIAGLFLGGSDAFKKDARCWCDYAHGRGLAFHFARCSGGDRIRRAISIGADSMDSCQSLRARKCWRDTTRAYYGGMSQGELLL